MNQQERSSLLQSIGKYIKSQFSVYERRLELAEQKAAQAIALDVDARIKLATIEAVTAATQKMQAELEAARKLADEATQKALDAVAGLRQPEDGKDADPEQIKQAVSDAVAKIPAPKDGKSVTLDELKPVIEEAVKREVEALPRPQDGKSVTVDDVRPVVDEAVKSAVAAIEIPEPRDGEDGRDALQLEILPIIDLDKSYPRGSYAKHAGGLWRAFEQTHGMRGWEVIVEGLAEHRIEQIDERTFEAVSVLSSGAEVRKSVSIPVVVDRGVFKADSEYKAGDGVTWGGSYWIATKDEPVGKPGEPGSDGWRLAVKRGRDGKDGRNGIDKTAPVRVDK